MEVFFRAILSNEAKAKLVQRLREIDLTKCPEDFRSVHIDWQRAIANYVNAMSKYDGWTGVGSATLAMFNGEYSVSEPTNVGNERLREVGKEYDRMTKVLLKYGLRNPLSGKPD